MHEDKVNGENSIFSLLLDDIKNSGGNLALLYGNNVISYDALEANIYDYVEKFYILGVTPSSNVIVNISKTTEYPIILLALLKLGAVVIPIDIEQPLNRYSNILKYLKIGLCLHSVEQEYAKRLDDLNIRKFIHINEFRSVQTINSVPTIKADMSSSGYIIFTSGTEGSPKGVFINQNNMIAYIKALGARLNLNNKDIFLHIASVGFSSSIRQLLLPMYYKAQVVLLDEESRKDLLETIDIIVERKITVLDITPSHLSSLITIISDDKDLQNKVSAHQVQVILTASEPLSKTLVEATYKIFGKVKFINMYGQTETAGIIATEVIKDLSTYNKFIHLGRPLDCVDIAILNENDGSMVDNGIVGEICVISPTVSNKILYNDKINIKNYGMAGEYYKTGDYGKKLPDGTIEFCGRKNNFIKINASRISIEEVKQNLIQYPDIKAAEIFLLCKQADAMPELVAAIVPISRHQKIEVSSIRSFLREKIPNYMIPTKILCLTEIPLNTNFKVDFVALTELFHKSENAKEQNLDYDLKAIILEIWKKVFDSETISEKEDFYSLGGNSLIAARIVVQINRRLSIKLKLTDILYNEKISDLVNIINKQQLLRK